MAYNFIPCDRSQSFLMPPSLSDWLPENHLAWFVLDACSQMDLSAFRAKYRADGWGAKAFSPDMMVSLLLYAYCMGERSSRKIERACETDVAFRVMAANTKPDHSTIARFRGNNLKQLEKLFTQILRLCAEAGLVKVGVVSIDGTKMEANAALAANKKHEGLEKEIEREVAKMLAEAESVDREEDGKYGKKRGDELPEDMRVQQTRIARLRECKERLESDAQDRAAEQQKKIDERAAKEAATGVKLRGRKLKEPDPTPSKEARANPTDPESRILKTRKGYVQGYNAQAAVTEEQIIVAAEVTQEENDVEQLHSTIAKTVENLKSEWKRIPDVIGLAASSSGFSRDLAWNSFGSAEGDAHFYYVNRIDRDFLETMELSVIEGQGSLFHPGYSGVSLGLLHGSQPDAFVLCHDATRAVISGWEHYALPSIPDCIDQHVLMGSRTNPDICCVGISVNTSALPADERLDYLAKLNEETGLPCVDPLIDGCAAIVEHIKQLYPEG